MLISNILTNHLIISKLNFSQHNLATRVDKAAIFEAYNEVMADNNNIEWLVFRSSASSPLQLMTKEDNILSLISWLPAQCHMTLTVTFSSCKLLPIKMSKWEMKRKPGQYLSISPP